MKQAGAYFNVCLEESIKDFFLGLVPLGEAIAERVPV
jgi:hypothetical protein